MPIHRENIARSHAVFSSFLENISRVGPYNGLDPNFLTVFIDKEDALAYLYATSQRGLKGQENEDGLYSDEMD